MFPILSYQNQYQFELSTVVVVVVGFLLLLLFGWKQTNSSSSSKWNCFRMMNCVVMVNAFGIYILT